MSEFRLFDGRIRTDEAIQKLDTLMELSFRNRWNVDFSFPDIGQYPNLQPLPSYRWASMLLYLLRRSEEQ